MATVHQHSAIDSLLHWFDQHGQDVVVDNLTASLFVRFVVRLEAREEEEKHDPSQERNDTTYTTCILFLTSVELVPKKSDVLQARLSLVHSKRVQISIMIGEAPLANCQSNPAFAANKTKPKTMICRDR